MNITVFGSAGGQAPSQDLAGFLIGDDLLVDAGTIGLRLPLDRQRRIRHVLLTHAHLDHHHALPFLLDNLIGRINDAVTVYSTAEILDDIHKHIFNSRIWPDFTVLPAPTAPVVRFQAITPGQPFSAGLYTVEAVPVSHTVPALGFIISDGQGTVVFTGDTGPSDALWRRVGEARGLRAIFMETSLPATHKEMALRTRHLTPADIEPELAKIGHPVKTPVFLYHLKPEYRDEITREVRQLRGNKVRIVNGGDVIKV